MENKKIRTLDLIVIVLFFAGTIIFVSLLLYFSKPHLAQNYKISSVDDMLVKINAEDVGINNEDVDYISDIKSFFETPSEHINKIVSWNGRITDIAEQVYKNKKFKFLKILTDDSSQFIGAVKAEKKLKINDIITVKGVIKGIYSYKDSSGEVKNLPVLKVIELEIKKAQKSQQSKTKQTKKENTVTTPEVFYTPRLFESPIIKPVPAKTPVEIKKTPQTAPSYEYKYSTITNLDEKYLKIAESYEAAQNKQKALQYYKKYLQVAPSGEKSESIKNKVNQLEGK